MPVRITNTVGGTGYVDIRVGVGHGIHQGLADVSTLGGSVDAEGYLPPGLPLTAAGDPVGAAESAYGIIGPEPVKANATTGADHFVNMIMSGVLNRDAIEDNLGRSLTADELAGIASGCPQIRLI